MPTRDPSATELPRVSVVMPVRNEGDFIAASLGPPWRRTTRPTASKFSSSTACPTTGRARLPGGGRRRSSLSRPMDNPARIVAPGLNLAVAQATGEVVVRVDGHCVIAPDYVRRCVEHLRAGEADGVGGSVETVGAGPTARAIAIAMSSPFGVGDPAFRTRRNETRLVDTVPFPAYTREILRRAGPFDEELVRNQDDEYNTRVRGCGGRILLAADVRSTYHSRPSFRSLWRQYFQYGFWKVRVFQKHPTQNGHGADIVPSLFVAVLAVSAILAVAAWRPAAALGVGALGAYVLASALTVVRAVRGEANGLWWRVLWSFWILHFAYGLGFLVGLLRFAGRWGDRAVVAASEGSMTRRVV